MEKSELRELFESEYPGKKAIFENLIQPIFAKAKDATLTDNQILSDSDKKQIKSFSIIAQVRGGFPITFADVEVQDSVALKRSRVNIQNCVRKMMANDSNAIIFFHFTNDKKEWRVSYCHRATTNKESTDAKRFTYLCGTEHACRTIAERFDTLQGLSTIKDEDMLEAFGVEPLSKEFFDKYREHYADLVEYISGKRFVKKSGKFVEEKTKNANGAFKSAFDGDDKLVRDYVKKMMGRLVFLHFLQKKGWLGVPQKEAWGNGDKNFIYNLFNNAGDSIKEDFLEQALEPLFFKTLNSDRGEDAIAPKAICDIYGDKVRIPYLNGGLFEEDDLDKKKVKFKKEHFEDLLDFFNQYNFTIDETDPDDQEIGVDPEMLGKIFENLLEDNKDKGAFYTPKEIVQYMCRESLIAYLEEKTGLDTRDFVINHTHQFTKAQQADVLDALLNVKVCDPAVGSGAFPMGMMNELLACTQLLIGEGKTRSQLKKHIVKNNIYGVDIEKGAVDIARLRFWLAIIVDENEPIPLPNLDYKIMQGNSLLEYYEGIDLSHMLEVPPEGEFDYNEEQRTLLKTNMDEYFDDNNHEDKAVKNDIIKSLVYDLASATCGLKENSEKALQLHEKIWEGTPDFFLWHTWFNDVFNRPNDCNGFDIVIGNPPYIDSETMTNNGLEWERKLLQKTFVNLAGNWDIYMAFFELGLSLGSILSFITPDKWLSKGFGLKFRENQLRRRLSLITKAGSKVFESATVDAIITLFKRKSNELKAYEFTTSDIISFRSSKNVNNIDKPYLIDFMFSENSALVDKINLINSKISDYCECEGACATSDFYVVKELIEENKNPDKDKYYKLINTGTIGKYYNKWDLKPISYDGQFNYPVVQIKKFEEKLGRTYIERAKRPKLILKGINLLDVCLDETAEILPGKSTMVICSEDIQLLKFLMGVLNSRLPIFYIKNKYSSSSYCGGITFTKDMINNFPLKFTKEYKEKIINLVNKILTIKEKDPQTDTTELETQIDELVYDLYDLSSEERNIIKNNK